MRRHAHAGLLLTVVAMSVTGCGDKAPSVAGLSRIERYEGKIVRQPPSNRGKADGWYWVHDGKRHWISNGGWLKENGFRPEDVIEIPSSDLAAIPEDDRVLRPSVPLHGKNLLQRARL